MKLTSDVELADEFGLDLPTFTRMRQKHGWPHVRLGRFEIRFTESQIQEIVKRHSLTPKKTAAEKSPSKLGQPTARSSARSA